MLVNAHNDVGLDGIISIEDSQLSKTKKENGYIRYEEGYFHSGFSNDFTGTIACLEHDPYVLIADQKLQTIRQLRKLLEEIIDIDAELLIIASEISKDLLNGLLQNVHHHIFKVVAAQAPGYGSTRQRNLMALAVRTGATYIDGNGVIPLTSIGLEACGRIKKAVIEKRCTKLYCVNNSCDNSHFSAYLKRIQSEYAESKNNADCEKYGLALSILKGGNVSIHVGGTTQAEMFEQKFRYDQALRVARTAICSGVVPRRRTWIFANIPCCDRIYGAAFWRQAARR